ncbi:MAG: tRNA uridine-5-carboxymethylaminomethyl(34) synthesis enzyme MnmG [Planctomycetes bacterium]|nr:tRNA uridine-5-carboxymethylaminomethyl(34) synthesis enzyme MnmG [Planctomycetota bacterium]
MDGTRDFDVVVVGGGHAGAEAALAAARLGAATACVVLDPAAIGRMSCNPAIGGIAKGHLVREIDALGGEMAACTDAAGIQFRMLNTRKGPAVRAPRAQCDRALYNREMAARVAACPRLTLVAGEAVELPVGRAAGAARAVRGVRLADGRELAAPAVVLTTGTFLGGRLFAGEWEADGGRHGERGATALARALRGLGLRLGRHKTGTPPRLHRDSIDYARLEEQLGDDPPRPFSFRTGRLDVAQVSCWLTRTNARTHAVVARHAHRSPMYAGRIVGVGPRYCPSLEDKVMRFADRDAHLVFLEPEGRASDEVYPNGISTSLPPEVQEELVRTIPGLEDVRILRHGYAVEYDYLLTDQLRADLHVADVAGLFAAGQINGTSGYEEAAAQGLVAGINAARFARGEPPLVLDRASSYLGVMIDDLCRVNPSEPYRMFTSRAEFRLLLRADNADRRLTPIAREIGLCDAARAADVARKEARIGAAVARLEAIRRDGRSLAELLRRPEVTFDDVVDALGVDAPGVDPCGAAASDLAGLHADERAEVEAEIKYAGYIARQHQQVERLRAMDARRIPAEFDFAAVVGLSNEGRERLLARRPLSVGEATRLAGVTPADVNLLLVALGRAVSRA